MSDLAARVNRLDRRRPVLSHRPLEHLSDAELDELERLVVLVEASGWTPEAYDLLASDAIQSALGKLK